MNDLTTQINKENEADTEEFLQDNREDTRLIDVTIFDETLKEIEKILNNSELVIHKLIICMTAVLKKRPCFRRFEP